MKAWAEGRYEHRHLPVLCGAPDCHATVYAKGWCKTHYKRIAQQHRLRTDPAFRKDRADRATRWNKENPERRDARSTRANRVGSWARYLASSCSGAARKRGLTCDLDADYLLDLFEKQKGRCYWLGIPMVPSVESRNPARPSVDRLVPTLGYVRGNVVLSTQFANMGRNACPADRFADFVAELRRALSVSVA